jgi:hypothetical protein
VLHDVCEGLQLLDVDDVEQVGAGVVKVRAEVVFDLIAHALHGLVEDRLDQGHAATTACAGFCASLDFSDGLASAVLDAVDHIAFGDVVARADLSVIVEVISVLFTFACADDEFARWDLQLLLVLYQGNEFDL